MWRPAEPDDGMADARPGPDWAEELLDTRRRPGRRPRFVSTALALVVLSAAAVLVAVHDRGRTSHRNAVPPPSVSVTPAPVTTPQLNIPVADSGAPPALMIGSTVYIVRQGTLLARRVGSLAESSVTIGNPADSGAAYLLAPDPAHGRIWVVKTLPGRILIYAYELAGLREIRAFNMEGYLAGIDYMRGEFYLSSSAGVVGIASTPKDLLDWTPFRGGHAIAADPIRNRLLVLDDAGSTARILTTSADLKRTGVSAALPLRTGTFVVVNGRIWAGGRGAHGAVLVRLDPRTLQPIRHSELEVELGHGAVLAAAGARSFLVRDGSGGHALWCVDADSGKVLHRWSTDPAPVVVATQSRGANPIYVIPAGSDPVPLAAGSCPG